MGLPVAMGASLMCSMGMAPSTLTVLPIAFVTMENKPAATIMDNLPMVNILPFGTCISLLNPVTAAQTAAALGVLTPGACLPVTPAPWVPGSPTVMIANKLALNNASTCNCVYGGVITILVPGTTTETIP